MEETQNIIKSKVGAKQITLNEIGDPYKIEQNYREVLLNLDILSEKEVEKVQKLLAEQRKLKIVLIMHTRSLSKLPSNLHMAIRGNVQNYFLGDITQADEKIIAELSLVNIIKE